MTTVKNILMGEEAREKLAQGIDVLANAVKVTLGPQGRNVVIDNIRGLPRSTKDGVTVARHVFMSDPFLNAGAKMLKEVAGRQNFKSGDGTTTATVLAQAILKEGMPLVKKGTNAMDVKRGIEAGVEAVLSHLTNMADKVKDRKDILNVATISANGDVEIGTIMADAIEKLGRDAVLTVEEAKDMKTRLELVDGLEVATTIPSAYFLTDFVREIAEIKNPRILLVQKSLTNIRDLFDFLSRVAELNDSDGSGLVIVAEEIDGEVLQTLIRNKNEGNQRWLALRTPDVSGEERYELYNDLAMMTGATVIGGEKGIELRDIKLAHLGSCTSVKAQKNSAVFVGGNSDKEKVLEYVEELRTKQSAAVDDESRSKIEQRLGRLVGSVGVIHVGGVTEVEVKERKDRVDDAVGAVKAALRDGILPGGGSALYECSQTRYGLVLPNYSQEVGVKLLQKALEAPLRQIITNAGGDVEKILKGMPYEGFDPKNGADRMYYKGYNAATMKYEDLLQSGVIDPVRVVKNALQNAASVAALVLVTETLMVEPRQLEDEDGN